MDSSPPTLPAAAAIATPESGGWLKVQGWAWLGLGALYYVFDAGRQQEPDLAELLGRSFAWMLSGAVLSTTWLVVLRALKVHERPLYQQLLVTLGGALVGGNSSP